MMGVIDQIAEVGERVYNEGLFPRVIVWINTQNKRKRNPRAILYTLEQCLKYQPEGPWAWCEKVIQKASPKFNARDHAAQFQGEGNDYLQMVNDLKKLYGGRNNG